MSGNRKIVMVGNVLATDVERVLRDYGAISVALTPSSTLPNRSRINFKQPSDDEDRMMIVHEAESYQENGKTLHKGPHTLAVLGAWGEHEAITDALLHSMQGYVLEETATGYVRVQIKDKAFQLAPSLARAAAEAAADAMAPVLGTSIPPRGKLVESIAALLSGTA